MNADRWRDVSRIYGKVAARPEPERAEAVAELCGDDPELRREVQSLLDEESGQAVALDRRPWDVLA